MSLATAFRLFSHGGDLTLPMQSRLRAWWEGEAEQLAPVQMAAKILPLVRERMANTEENPWSPERLALLSALWGPGYTSPGGEEYTIELLKPLAPTPAMSLLNLGAHLGGSARTIANVFQMWVNAFESNEDLARLGMAMSEREGMAKRAPVECCDHEALGAYLAQNRRQYDCIFSKEGFYRIANKEDLFEAINNHLKSDGQLLFTDYVLAESGETPEVTAWLASEKEIPPLWTAKQILKSMDRFDMDLRISEDVTARTRRMAIQAWAHYAERLRGKKFDPAMGEALLREVEIWARRVLAFDSGGLRVQRVHAIKQTSLSF